MDFLDPKRKKAHRQRLLLGYILMAVAVAIGTLILLFVAYGYDIDRKTGDVIQNGIVYVDSKPKDAAITINGVMQKARTSSRLVLPVGPYTFEIKKDGYRPWKRDFTLDANRIEQMVYPFLVPEDLKIEDVALYGTAPGFGSASPDRRWLLVQQPGQTYVFDLYDTASPAKAPLQLTMPKKALADPERPASLEVVEWSNDNRHVLFKRTYGDKQEFVVFDREAPADAYSLNSMFGINPTIAQLRNKRNDQFYVFDAAGGIVRSANSKDKTLSAPLLNNVLSFKSYNDDIILYVTPDPVHSDEVIFKILSGDKDYVLRNSPAGKSYLVSISKYDDHWYYTVGSTNLNNVFVYMDPIDSLKNRPTELLPVAAIVNIADPKFVSVSANSRFIAVQGNEQIATYDAYDKRQFKFDITGKAPAGQQLKWMDGHRLAFHKDSFVHFIDFDGANEQRIMAANPGFSGPFFDRDYDSMFTLSPSVAVSMRSALTRAQFEPK